MTSFKYLCTNCSCKTQIGLNYSWRIIVQNVNVVKTEILQLFNLCHLRRVTPQRDPSSVPLIQCHRMLATPVYVHITHIYIQTHSTPATYVYKSFIVLRYYAKLRFTSLLLVCNQKSNVGCGTPEQCVQCFLLQTVYEIATFMHS